MDMWRAARCTSDRAGAVLGVGSSWEDANLVLPVLPVVQLQGSNCRAMACMQLWCSRMEPAGGQQATVRRLREWGPAGMLLGPGPAARLATRAAGRLRRGGSAQAVSAVWLWRCSMCVSGTVVTGCDKVTNLALQDNKQCVAFMC